MDGYNITLKPDMFRFIDKLRCLSQSLKNFFRSNNLKVTIKDKKYSIIGKIGMYHMVIDISNSNIKMSDSVYLDINPLHVDSNIRREYI